ncbi:MAG: ABC transporter permease [Anaerolineaceae bacterium]|nr:ABC transporter permease [Anaerolineaceae bacterium]
MKAGTASFNMKRVVKTLATLHTFWVLLILLLLCIGFSIITPPGTFLSTINFKSLAADSSQLIILTIGAAYLLISAGIDLSTGSVLVLDTVLTVKLILWLTSFAPVGLALALGALFAVLLGIAIGIVNGLLVTKLRIPSFIATLGTMGATLGFARLASKGTNVPGVPRELMRFINTEVLGLPIIAFMALFLVILASVVLKYTRFGLHTVATGSNIESARRAGIKVEFTQISVYALMGLMVGVVAMIDLGRFGVASIAAHTTDNLQAIAGAVIGGTSLFGGRGSILGAAIGAFIPSVLRNGFIILGLQPFWQEVAVAFVLLAAVYFDQWRRAQMQKIESQMSSTPANEVTAPSG